MIICSITALPNTRSPSTSLGQAPDSSTAFTLSDDEVRDEGLRAGELIR